MTPETTILPDGREVVLIHFLARNDFNGGHIACMPGLKDMASNQYRQSPHMRTDSPDGVTCVMCKKTAEFRHAAGQSSADQQQPKPEPAIVPKFQAKQLPVKGTLPLGAIEEKTK